MSGRAGRRRADRRVGGAGGLLLRAVDEEHVLVRAAHPGAGAAAAGLDGTPRMIGAVARHAACAGACSPACSLALLLAAPLVADRYLLSVLILIFYFAYVGQAWNLMMGFAGPALARPRALCRARRLCGGAAVGLFRDRAVARRVRRDRGRGAGGRGDRLARLSLRHRGRLFRAADHRVRRIHPHRVRSHRRRRRRRRAVSALRRRSASANGGICAAGSCCSTTSALALAVGAAVLTRLAQRSRLGYQWLAVREDEQAARALGIDVFARQDDGRADLVRP